MRFHLALSALALLGLLQPTIAAFALHRAEGIRNSFGVAKMLQDDMPSVNVTFGVGASLFNKIFADIVPIFDLLNVNFPVPGINETHFEFNSFNLSDIQLAALQTTFSQPSTFTLSLQGLSLTIPAVDFLVRDTLLGIPISCQGSFWGNASQTNMDLAINIVTTSDGTLNIQSVTPTVSFGSLFVNHTIDGSFCQGLVGIIRDFLGSLNKLIEKLIKKDLPSKLADAIMKEGNKALPKIPYVFVTQPEALNDTLALQADLTKKHPKHRHGADVTASGTVGHVHIFVDRDLAVGMSTASANNLLLGETLKGKLDVNKLLKDTTAKLKDKLPGAYKMCPNCPLAIDFRIQPAQPPQLNFHDDVVTLSITNSIVGLNAYNNATDKIVQFIDAYLNLSLSLVNFSVTKNGTESLVFFDLQLNDFALSQEHSILGNLIDFKKIGEIAEDILWAWLIPEFNAKFRGLTIAVDKDGVGLDDWLIDISGDALTFGLNLLLPKL